MNEKIKEILYLSTMILFIVLFSLTIVSFYFINQSNSPYIISFFVRYHVFFMFSIAILGLIFGFSSNYLLSKRLGENKEKMQKTISSLLNLISSEERKIIIYLIKNKGGSTQYELSKLENMTKLKVHRALDKLEQKNIITKQKIGKINKIFLNKEISI